MQGNLPKRQKDSQGQNRAGFLLNEIYDDMGVSAISLDITGVTFSQKTAQKQTYDANNQENDKSMNKNVTKLNKDGQTASKMAQSKYEKAAH